MLECTDGYHAKNLFGLVGLLFPARAELVDRWHDREAQSAANFTRDQAEGFLSTAANFISLSTVEQIRLAPDKCERN